MIDLTMTDGSAPTSLALAAALALLSLAPAAEAKSVAADPMPAPSSTVAEDAVLYAGPIGAMLESNYFRAKHAQSASDKSLCRLHPYFSNQPFRLARTCE
jgi:hypothetical protein